MPPEMTPAQLEEYNKKYPPMKSKQGRFSPDGQFYQCSSPEEIEKLEAAGWNTNPFDHDEPYKPEDAVHRVNWADIKFPKAAKAEKGDDPPAPSKGKAAKAKKVK